MPRKVICSTCGRLKPVVKLLVRCCPPETPLGLFNEACAFIDLIHGVKTVTGRALVLEHVPPQLKWGDSHETKDGRVYRH